MTLLRCSYNGVLGMKQACHMVIDLSRADREYIGEVNNFELINPVLSRFVQSSRSFEIRGDNEALFFLAARFFSSFFFQTATENIAFQAAQKL